MTTGTPTNDETPETDPNPAQTQKAARIAAYEAKRAGRIERLNLSARIRDAKMRAARVEKIQTAEASEKVVNGVTIEYAPQENRIRVHFQDRVSKEIFQQLKRAGFRHAPSQGKFTFSAYYNNWTKQNAEQIVGKMEVPAN